ncbi:MAG: CDP-archaeol synthase [Gammaproteobacteria bacterium]
MSAELFQLLLLIIIANGTPIIIRWLLNDSFDLAVDFGQKLPDNKRIFGSSKTWRGVLSALLVTPVVAWFLGHSIETGLLVAVYAIFGDLCSSFIKRRLAMKPSSMAPLLDQVPESLFPAYMLRHVFNLEISSVIWLVLIFIIIELVLSHILYKWGLRKRPY